MDIKDTLKKTAVDAIDSNKQSLIALSKEIWENPELAYEEFKANKVLVNFLQSNDFKVENEYKLPTSFRAEFGNKEAPNIGIMCEYDALPDIGHACGHNIIAQLGIGAGLGVKKALEKANVPVGKVTVLGCPAEESGGGKVDLIRAGAFKDIDVAMMCHPGLINSPGTIILAMTEVFVTYKGKASHAAGFPWQGVNALDAAVMCYTNVSCMRQQLKPEWRVHGIITKGGAKPNIIPEEAQVHYYLRAPTVGQLEELTRKVKGCFEAAAVATGCTVSYEWDDKPYENMMSNRVMEELYSANVQQLGLELCKDPVILSKPTGSTDMGNVSHVVPSIHPRFDIKPEDVAHSRLFRKAAGTDFALEAGITQAKALAMTAIDILCDGSMLQRIKESFEQDSAKDKST